MGVFQILISFSVFVFVLAAKAYVVPGKVETITNESTDAKFSIIKISGTIAYPMASELEEAFAKIEEHKTVLLHLNSEGGSQSEGEKIIEILKNERANRLLRSMVFNGEMCASMCIPIYLQAQKREAAEVANFMFHGATKSFSNIPSLSKTQRYIDTCLEAGVSKKFIDHLLDIGVFTTPGEYWLTGKELYELDANVVTSLKPKHVKFKPWSAPIDPQIGSY